MMASVCKVGDIVVNILLSSVLNSFNMVLYIHIPTYCLYICTYVYTSVYVGRMVCAIVFVFLCYVCHLKCTQMEHLLAGPHPHSHLLHFQHM